MRAINLLLATALLAPVAANAIPITVTGAGANDGAWDVTLVEDSFNNLETLLTGQVWWEDSSLALIFADALGPVTGVNNLTLGLGPAFAYSFQRNPAAADQVSFAAWSDGSVFGSGARLFNSSGLTVLDLPLVYAVAERVQVPEPGTLALLCLGLAGIALAAVRRSNSGSSGFGAATTSRARSAGGPSAGECPTATPPRAA